MAVVSQFWLQLLTDGGEHSNYYVPAEDALERWKSDFPGWISAADRFLAVADVDGVIAGYIHACVWDLPPVFVPVNEVFVNEIYVLPEWRKQGIGQMLLDEVITWASRQGAENIRVTAISEKPDSIAFWKSVGARPLTTDLVLAIEPKGNRRRKRTAKLGF